MASGHGQGYAPRMLRRRLRRAAPALAAALLAGCASVTFERDTPTSGTFDSTAWAFTLFGYDFPSTALQIARGNASDSGLPNLIVEEQSVLPRLGPLDWLLDILMVRRAHVSGTWGLPPPP